MEVDGGDEVLLVAETTGGVLHAVTFSSAPTGWGSPHFIGLRGPRAAALFDGLLGATLFSFGNHLGDLLGVGGRSWDLCRPAFLPMFSGVPKWSLAAQPSSGAPRSA